MKLFLQIIALVISSLNLQAYYCECKAGSNNEKQRSRDLGHMRATAINRVMTIGASPGGVDEQRANTDSAIKILENSCSSPYSQSFLLYNM